MYLIDRHIGPKPKAPIGGGWFHYESAGFTALGKTKVAPIHNHCIFLLRAGDGQSARTLGNGSLRFLVFPKIGIGQLRQYFLAVEQRLELLS